MKRKQRLFHGRNWLWALLFVILLHIFLSGCQQSQEAAIFLTEEERQWLDEHAGQIKIGYTTDYPPVEFLINGEYVGISADYFKLLEEKLEFAFEMVEFDQWTDLMEKAMNREIAGITAATKTPARSEYFEFTVPYIFNPNVIVTRENYSEKLSFEKLANSSMSVLVVEGYSIVEYLDDNYPRLEYQTVGTASDGLRKVSFGEADVMIIEVMSAAASIDHDKITNLVVNTETPYESHLSIATRNDWPMLNDILNKGLAQISDGEKQTIRMKWVPFDRTSVLENPYFWMSAVAILILLSGAIILITIWNRTLTKVVKEKTQALEESRVQLMVQNQQLEKTEIRLREEIKIRTRSEEEIKFKSYHDSLTGLYNRAYYSEVLDGFEQEGKLPFSILLADLNGLKITNDTLGHEEGDRLLVRVAGILKASVRPEDLVARIGGDEFVVVMPDATEETAEKIGANIKTACRQAKDEPIKPSLALGFATKKVASQSVQSVFKKAEDNMYENKMYESESANASILGSLKTMLRETTSETSEHCHRLETMAVNLGKAFGLGERDLNALVSLADLHDLGKVAIPEEILQKPGPLTEEEWERIKRHPDLGFRIANTSPKLAQIAEGILSHHERWDGKGYPHQLKGEKIPLLARIIAIVDAYDVMTNERPYKKIKTKEEALEELKLCAGTQFDPNLVDLFIQQMKQEP
ncbi:HD domain-containing phosphohydrolase [Anoxynatronum sibiricum]|uniref:HD domain-containing phosphohydrolase n=1 Tax=Anoxynatronum sibiricum TaxID=210623 RepID=A0ABU9VT37_9CLOT